MFDRYFHLQTDTNCASTLNRVGSMEALDKPGLHLLST